MSPLGVGPFSGVEVVTVTAEEGYDVSLKGVPIHWEEVRRLQITGRVVTLGAHVSDLPALEVLEITATTLHIEKHTLCLPSLHSLMLSGVKLLTFCEETTCQHAHFSAPGLVSISLPEVSIDAQKRLAWAMQAAVYGVKSCLPTVALRDRRPDLVQQKAVVMPLSPSPQRARVASFTNGGVAEGRGEDTMRPLPFGVDGGGGGDDSNDPRTQVRALEREIGSPSPPRSRVGTSKLRALPPALPQAERRSYLGSLPVGV